MRRFDHRGDLDAGADSADSPGWWPAPGRRTLTMGLPSSSAVRPEVVQRQAAGAAAGAAPIGDDPFALHLIGAPVTAPGTSGGLPATLGSRFEQAFGVDLSSVRVHEGSALAADAGARAFAQGRDLHFAPGQYDPSSESGRQLIGHEIAHVVQQAQGRATVSQAAGWSVNDDPALEAEADDWGARALRGESVLASAPPPSAGATLQGKFYENKRGQAATAARIEAVRASAEAAGDLVEFDKRLNGGRWFSLKAYEQRLGTLAIRDDDAVVGDDSSDDGGQPRPAKRIKQVESRSDRVPRGAKGQLIEEAASSSESDMEEEGVGSDREDEPLRPVKVGRKPHDEDVGSDDDTPKKKRGVFDFLASSQQAVDSADESPMEEEPAPVESESRSRPTRGNTERLLDPKSVANLHMQKQIKKLPREVNKADDLQALSRLAMLIESVGSGTTCAAVWLEHRTLYITANSTGPALAKGADLLLRALDREKFDRPLVEMANPAPAESESTSKPRTVYFGKQLVQPTSGDRGKVTDSALSLATKFRAGEIAGRGAPKAATVTRATVDAERRLGLAAAWLKLHPIEKVVVRDGKTGDKHAEMRLLEGIHQHLAAGGKVADLDIGISKLCCALCFLGVELFRKLHPDVTVNVQGTHTKTYGKWPVPKFVESNLPQFANLAAGMRADEKFRRFVDGDTIDPRLKQALIPVLVGLNLDPHGDDPKGRGRATATEYWSNGESSDSEESSSESPPPKRRGPAPGGRAAPAKKKPAKKQQPANPKKRRRDDDSSQNITTDTGGDAEDSD